MNCANPVRWVTMEGEITKVGCLDEGETNVRWRAGTDDEGVNLGSTWIGVENSPNHEDINESTHPPQLVLEWTWAFYRDIKEGYSLRVWERER